MTEKLFKKVMVANRGEIAIRIFRACYDLDIRTVAIYSKEDTMSLFRTKADEAYLIGEKKSPLGAYLAIDEIIPLAKRRGVEAIHPGYGFLAENPAFAKACEDAGIKFIGPPSSVLAKMGDKLEAKKIAVSCGVPIVPGSTEPLGGADEALQKAEEFGFPVILKAAAGGGGRGMRLCEKPEDIAPAFELVKNEAKKAFGDDSIFIEKYLIEPKHIEVQILADEHGCVRHLGERDCSLQRRYQKVVEFAPAWSVPQEIREKLYADAVRIAEAVGYVNAGTVEFLVDKNGGYYFIEMNPRIQVEHTVTEMVTGIDLVRAQLLIASGVPLSHPEIDLGDQRALEMNGYAIQCRVTTEDPANNFAPDNGKISAYRSGGGFGVRLDGGNAAAGSVISPYYDSLLVKVTCWDRTFEATCRKARRAINEEHVRGVKTNIPFVTNILSHPTFIAGQCHTRFIDATPELFDITAAKDRATRVLKYIAGIQVANPDAERRKYDTPHYPEPSRPVTADMGLKHILDTQGPEALSKWVLAQKKLLVTDTTMRDAHQSLISTRMRTRDMLKAAEGTADYLADCFSLEMWGGATFDTAYRFLYESPWERLEALREKIPNIPLQMLLRGSNLVGYSSYPDNLVRAFVQEAAKCGIDVFRVFDSLNWIPSMETAMDEVLKTGKVLEATMCYTGDILDPKRDRYTLNYYVDLAKALEKRGAHTLCVKDMSGLLKPYGAKKLVSTLKQEIGIPIHLHTHNTTDNQIATYILAAEAGVDIVDCAIGPMSSLTSQPSLNSLVESLRGNERDTGLDPDGLQKLADYWSDIRMRYTDFDKGMTVPMTEIYRYEIPGGQYTNLQPQVEALGLGHRFGEVKEMYRTVNDMLGDIIKVTPSSKMVGDLAIFMVQNNLTPDNIVQRGESLAFPDSVVSYFNGMMGQPPCGFPEGLQRVVLKGEKPITCRPGELLPPVDWDKIREKVGNFAEKPSWRSLISYAMYPKVMEDFFTHRKEYGYITRMGSHVFFNGLAVGETTQINIEDGKTLVIKYLGLGDRNEDGTRAVQFELNGMRREVNVPDPQASETSKKIVMANPDDKGQVGASIPGMVSKISVKAGDTVKENQVLAIIEAMKMETSVVSRINGVVDELFIEAGNTVKSGELLMTIK
ncbi:MAG TPA: pyruvate carboxylase [Clostridiales bacterium]|nr:pyruvate carboxylase [Clostridiales bacterium]